MFITYIYIYIYICIHKYSLQLVMYTVGGSIPSAGIVRKDLRKN